MNMSIGGGRTSIARQVRARARVVPMTGPMPRTVAAWRWLAAFAVAAVLALSLQPAPAHADTAAAPAPAGAAARAPVAKVTSFTGNVEFSTDGQRWRPLKRARLLFAGYRVRTGANSTASVVGQGNDAYDLAPRSVVVVEGRVLRVLAGQGTRPQQETGLAAFFGDVTRRFVSRQRYTTVRRNVIDSWQVLTPDHVSASADFPTLVWQNGGEGVRYRVHVGSTVFDVPAANAGAAYVSHELSGIAAGTHPLRIEVLDAAGTVRYVDPNGGELVWLGATESAVIKARHEAMLADPTQTDDDIAEFLSEQGLLVLAMYHCRDYLQDNPEDEAMSLAYLKVLKELRLDALHAKQVAAMAQVASNE